MNIEIKIEYTDKTDNSKSYSEYKLVNREEFMKLYISNFYNETWIDKMFDNFVDGNGALVLKVEEEDPKLENFEKYIKPYVGDNIKEQEEFMKHRVQIIYETIYENGNDLK